MFFVYISSILFLIYIFYFYFCFLFVICYFSPEINPFRKFFNNKLFVSLVIIIIGIQTIAVQLGGDFVKTTALNGSEWGFCIGLAVMSFPVGKEKKISQIKIIVK